MPKSAILLVLIFSLVGCASSPNIRRQPAASPQVAFDELVSEMERLDGEFIELRNEKRHEAWAQVSSLLKSQFQSADSDFEISEVFRQLDQAYPSRHASIQTHFTSPAKLVPTVRFRSHWIAPGVVQLVVSQVDADAMFMEAQTPVADDQVIAINQRPIESWYSEAYDFCKFPLKSQCSAEFAEEFRLQNYSWNESQPLQYTLKRRERTWNVSIPLRVSRGGGVTIENGHGCRTEKDRYQGFSLAYSGENACAYSTIHAPGTLILRITSFRYGSRGAVPSVNKEVTLLHKWLVQQRDLRHLIIDVVDNGGGDNAAPYFRLLLGHPFRESVQFRIKKVKELEDPHIRSALFWGSKDNEKWFQSLKSSAAWETLAFGSYLPALPQFCNGDRATCHGNALMPLPSPFLGRVTVLMNRQCMSSCDHFVFMAKDFLGSRVTFIGEPTTADMGYARLAIHVLKKTQSGQWTRITPTDENLGPDDLAVQSVVVSQTRSNDDKILDGHPFWPDIFVPTTSDDENEWIQNAVRLSQMRRGK
jgi:hypothetical protein